jgi:hypothetical protein
LFWLLKSSGVVIGAFVLFWGGGIRDGAGVDFGLKMLSAIPERASVMSDAADEAAVD